MSLFEPLNLSPESLRQEAEKIEAKLRAGIENLQAIGPAVVGASDKQEVWRDGKVALYRYQGVAAKRGQGTLPLLICYALVNRPYMVDLQADRSIVKSLMDAGQDVYILDWGYPDGSDRYLNLEDYVEGFLGGAVDYLRRAHAMDAINLLGICQGGALSLCYAALHPDKVKNLVTMVTPVDFHTDDNMLSNWTREVDVDAMVAALGNVSGDLMNGCYLSLKPYRLLMQKYVGMVDILDNPKALEDFLRMERWIFDSPDQPGELFREFITQFYQGNGFINGGIKIGAREVDLARIKMPVLNIYAEQDHLVPPDASRPLGGLIDSKDYTEISFKGGHIGIYVSGRAQREVPPAIHDWLQRRSR